MNPSIASSCQLIPLDDSFVCLDADSGRVYLANETGALIVQWYCQGWSEQAMAAELAERYGLAEQQVAADVSLLLPDLLSNSLPIQDSEFGLAKAGSTTDRHRLAGGQRFRLCRDNAGPENSAACLPALYLCTNVGGLAEQIARVFDLPELEAADTSELMDVEHSTDIMVGHGDNGFFMSVGTSLVAECDNRSALLHYCVGYINTRWTVSQTHDVVLHAAAVSMGELVVVMPASSGSGKSTLATWLALQGCTFWGDDLIALTNNARSVVPSAACASVKRGSRAVVFETLRENAQAYRHGWNDQSIMLEQVKAPANKHSGVPGCFLFPQYDEHCTSMQVSDIDGAQAFTRLAQAGLATHLGTSHKGLEALCVLLNRCKKIHVRYNDCNDVWRYLQTLEKQLPQANSPELKKINYYAY